MSASPRRQSILRIRVSRLSWSPTPLPRAPSRAGASRSRACCKTGVDVVDSEMVVFEWLGKAGTPEFKELLGLVK